MSTAQQVATALGSPMSSAEYVTSGGGICPFCGESGSLSGGMLDVEITTAWQQVDCSECGKRWHDIYKLSHYEETT